MSRPLLAALALAVAACGSSGETGTDGTDLPTPTPVPTISGVGSLPDTIPPEREVALVVVTRPVTTDGTPVELIGEQVAGNRLLVIGDSIMAATASRFGREMCDALVPMRWAVEVNAEPGRFVDFGTRVLDRRLDTEDGDWDAVAVHLGSNYRGEIEPFEAELSDIVTRVAPRPMLLFTVTEYRPDWAEVNEVIRSIARDHEHVTLVDWESVARTPGVLSGDGLHPTDAGEALLVELTAATLGPARVPIEGECLRTDFTDDSAIGRGAGGTTSGGSSTRGSSSGGSTSGGSGGGGSGGSSGGSSGGGSGGGGGSGVTTTVGSPSGGSTTTTPGGGSGGGGSGGGATTTSPPVTAPPTSPPPTSPPSTSPPSTSPPPPPPTSPPTTPTLPPPTAPPTTGG